MEADARADKEAEERKKELIQIAFKAGVETKTICEQAGVKDLNDIDPDTYEKVRKALLKKCGQ